MVNHVVNLMLNFGQYDGYEIWLMMVNNNLVGGFNLPL